MPPLRTGSSFFFSLLILTVTLLLSQGTAAGEMIDRILVIVNDEIITTKDLDDASEPVLAQYRSHLSGQELELKSKGVRKAMLDQLIDDRLVRSWASRANIIVDESEVDEMMSDVRSKFPSDEVFEKALLSQNLSFKKLRDRFRDRILLRRITDIEVRSEISVSPGQIRDYYDAHKSEFVAPDQAKVSQILIRVGPERTVEEAQELAFSIVKELDGTSMAELARLYSEAAEAKDGGDMGWVDQGQFVERIDRTIFGLKIGEHSEPIKSQLGFHIFKVEDKKESVIRPFEQVRRKIQTLLFAKETEQKMKTWLKELRQDAYIAHQT
jgi:peptidyl-prolyl cis-trans isomerase SurA